MSPQANPTAPAVFQDINGRFRVVVRQRLLTTLRQLGAESAGRETGGILAGYYNDSHDMAIIPRREGPPADAKMKSDCFYRGTRGRRNLLKRLGEVQEYSLGEWHYHPRGQAQASHQDRRPSQDTADDAAIPCPEPLLIIPDNQGN